MVIGRTPPLALSRLTWAAFLAWDAMMPQALCVSISSRYASWAHWRKRGKNINFQPDGPGLECLPFLMRPYL